MEQLLTHYGLLETLKRKGDNLTGPCPMHHGKNQTQFHVSLRKNNFHCFGDCKSDPTLHDGGGNLLDFVRKMEEIEEPEDPQSHKATRTAALLVQKWFNIASTAAKAKADASTAPAAPHQGVQEAKVKQPTEAEDVPANPLLTFAFQRLDPEHPYLAERGFTEATIAHFGVGYHAGRGIMHGRVVIPIHNEQGELIAYAGRWPGDEPPEGEGKYRLPPNFHKSLVVFNLHRAREHAGAGLVVVEGYFDVMYLWQAGIPHVVALMGSTLSDEQERLIVGAVGPQGKVTLLFDGDAAGRACTEEVLRRLGRQVYVRAVDLLDTVQPDHLGDEEIRRLLA
jgi:DNA primase